MRRIEMFQNDDKSFNADFFASVISSWLNEEIEIKKAIKVLEIGIAKCKDNEYLRLRLDEYKE